MSSTTAPVFVQLKSFLKLHPTIIPNPQGSFYVDDYTGEPIANRIGLPGHLCGDTKNVNLIYGAFEDLTVLRSYVEEFRSRLEPKNYEACCSWINSCAGQTVWPLEKSRILLVHFGGPLTIQEWRQANKFIPSPTTISVQQDIALREAAKKAKKDKEKENAMNPEKAEFDLDKFVKGHSQGQFTQCKVQCFAPAKFMSVVWEETDGEAGGELDALADDGDLRIPGYNAPSHGLGPEYHSPTITSMKDVPKHLRKTLKTFAIPKSKEAPEPKKSAPVNALTKKRSRAPKKAIAPELVEA